ncbi:flagellin N-terminal helical domain-containing protein [Segnochrobactrum spirostomi]|uniref:Flagellin n=1 Tax=Segnochrobactrum spirostomi TaxID=2608987 RepID=A0A6A7Y229_9HYPH|nr:flagellin [Segnochrobactrum spirostomi]MQT12776.1 flagellin [Segnochrobactrum spirostomi]
MTSLITNNSATVALSTLRSINSQLDTVNTRVSTGKRINSASDGAAYWSISTTLTSDNGALGSVKDAIGLDKNTVDAAAGGLKTVLDSLNTLKNKLTTAMSTSADRGKLQQEISSTLDGIKSVSDNTVMNGTNWLSVDSSATNYNSTKALVSSFSRSTSSTGTSTVNVSASYLDTGAIMLYDKKAAATTVGSTVTGTAAVATAATQADSTDATLTDARGAGFTVAISTATGAQGGFLDTVYSVAFNTFADGGTGTDTIAGTSDDPADTYTAGTAAAADDFSISKMDISKLSNSYKDLNKIQAYVKVVDATIQQLTAGATTLGATSSRLTSQQNFAQSLMDTNTSSIGNLVDADMEQESSRLKALQTQQQIGVQSLSIANSTTSNLLSLFR